MIKWLSSKKNEVMRVVRLILTVTSIYFVMSWYLNSQNELSVLFEKIDGNTILILGIAGIFSNILLGVQLHHILSSLGFIGDSRLTISSSLESQIAKYLPGKVFGILYQGSQLDFPGGVVVIFIANLKLMIGLILGTLVFSASSLLLYIYPLNFLIPPAIFAVLYFLFRFTGTSKKNLIFMFFNKYFSKTVENVIQKNIAIRERYLSLCCWVSIYILNTAIQVFMIVEVVKCNWETAFQLSGIYSLAWFFSAISFISPAGIGIREFALVQLPEFFGVSMSIPELTMLALSFRFWSICLDIVSYLVGRFYRHKISILNQRS